MIVHEIYLLSLWSRSGRGLIQSLASVALKPSQRPPAGLAVFRRNGHAPRALRGRCEDRVSDRRSKPHEAGFAGSGRWQVLAIEKHDFYIRCVAEARNAVLGK